MELVLNSTLMVHDLKMYNHCVCCEENSNTRRTLLHIKIVKFILHLVRQQLHITRESESNT